MLAATAFAGLAPALAQGIDHATADVTARRAQVGALAARPTALEAARSTTAAASTTPPEESSNVRFRGAPQITAPGGWSFKPRGRLQYDVGHVSRPGGISSPGLGFSNELRRARLGIEGSIP